MINIKLCVILVIKEVDYMLNEEIELEKGISLDVVKNISEIKGEPNWMKEFRMESYKFFEKCI